MSQSRRQFLGTLGVASTVGVGGCPALEERNRLGDLDEWPPTPYSSTLTYWSWQHYWRNQAQAFQFEANLEDINGEIVSALTQFQRLADGESPDIVSLPSRLFERAIEADLLDPFPPEIVPFWPPAEDLYTHDRSFYLRDGKCYGFPQTPMTYAMSYHREELNRPSSWSLLWDESLAGHISMPNDPILLSQIAALYTDQHPNDPNDVSAIREALLAQRPLINSYWADWYDCWRGFQDASIQAAVLPHPRMCLCAQDSTPAIQVAPTEGILHSQNTLAIPKGADNPFTALRFINWAHDFKAGTNTTWRPSEWTLFPHQALDEDIRTTYEEVASTIDIDTEQAS